MRFRNQSARAHVLLAALVVSAPCVYADEAPKTAVPSLSDVLDASGVSVTGYMDASYASSPIAGGNELATAHGSDGESFALNQASLTIAKQPKSGWGGLVNVIGGQAVPILDAAEGSPQTNFNVTQAFVQYATGPMTIIAGKYVTLAGAEVIASPSDYAFSRSILFGYAIPYTHTGARLTYAVSDAFSVTVGANNGWNSQTYRHPTAELGATYTPIKPLTIILSAYVGNEPSAAATGSSQRQLLDAVVTWAATSKLMIIVNYDWAKQKDGVATGADASWNGVAAYAIFAVNDMWKVTLRGEYFNDKNGFATSYVNPTTNVGGQKWKEGTLSLSYSPSKSAELRLDLRDDTSDQDFFTETNSSTPKSSQFSYGLEALYKF